MNNIAPSRFSHLYKAHYITSSHILLNKVTPNKFSCIYLSIIHHETYMHYHHIFFQTELSLADLVVFIFPLANMRHSHIIIIDSFKQSCLLANLVVYLSLNHYKAHLYHFHHKLFQIDFPSVSLTIYLSIMHHETQTHHHHYRQELCKFSQLPFCFKIILLCFGVML